MPGPLFKSLFISHIVNASLYHMYSLFLSVSMNKALFFLVCMVVMGVIIQYDILMTHMPVIFQ